MPQRTKLQRDGEHRSPMILDRFRLDDRTAIVTGASSGLGVAFALALGQAGPNLVLGARRKEGLERTKRLVQEAGARAAALPTDVSDPRSAPPRSRRRCASSGGSTCS